MNEFIWVLHGIRVLTICTRALSFYFDDVRNLFATFYVLVIVWMKVANCLFGWYTTAKVRCVDVMQGHSQQHACTAAICWPLGVSHPLENV